jgi:hypothetical protein
VSVVLGIVGAFLVGLIASAVGYPARGGGFVILALAVVFAGALDYLLKRVLGYQSSRASLQALRRNEPQFHADQFAQDDDAIEAELADDLAIVRCRGCGVRVVPKPDRKCPSCQREIG